jgi:ribosomal protein S27AE
MPEMLDRWDCDGCGFTWYVDEKTTTAGKSCPKCGDDTINTMFKAAKKRF